MFRRLDLRLAMPIGSGWAREPYVPSTGRRIVNELKLLTLDELRVVFPQAHFESDNERGEVVVYTGWSVHDDGKTLIPMQDDA